MLQLIKKYRIHILFFGFMFMSLQNSFAQKKESKKDSVSLLSKKDSLIAVTDTTLKPINRPGRAALRSAILPGLGQVYNKKYWKVPIVYGFLGGCAMVFNYNLKNYKELKQAFIGQYNARVFKDSTEFFKIKPHLAPLSEESLRFNRDQFRRNVDYTVLVFAIIWGLNVMDAAVDAHLKSFDVSPDLSLKIKPGHSNMAGTNGLSLVMKIGRYLYKFKSLLVY